MKIIVDRNELEKRLTQARKGKLIEFCIVPSQFDSGRLNPALLHIGTVYNDGSYEDLESIYEFRRLQLVDDF
ncbi:hypothetical protein [Caproiciproducens sp. CPB-2]|uniref:hypothetical protein n=1 Tax=Caproiciproducens sp. CPB-2 TaxID=3030017 RepID=UPI0023DA29A2|nr:hypothetical protein [Caproiciproducens sp. CPB-2]MDF1495515.1 hypothetical protein [Caproiciproducens sp. CPB-2]